MVGRDGGLNECAGPVVVGIRRGLRADDLPVPDYVPAGGLPPGARDAFDRTGLVTEDLNLRVDQEEVRRVLEPGPGSLGDLALESAVTMQELSVSSAQVSRGRRALPRRTGVQAEPLSHAAEHGVALQGDDSAAAKQRLLPAAEQGSTDAMFDLDALAHARGDRSEARVWLSRAAALNAPLPGIDYISQFEQVVEDERLISPPRDSPFPRALLGRPDPDRVTQYWSRLSENGRKIFRGAAQIERRRGPGYTLDDIGEVVGLPVGSVRSMHRSTGRTAGTWRRETGSEAPIKLKAESYGWSESRKGDRTAYRLPPGVADLINKLEGESL